MLQKVDAQHDPQSHRRTPVTLLRVMRLDQRLQLRPRHDPSISSRNFSRRVFFLYLSKLPCEANVSCRIPLYPLLPHYPLTMRLGEFFRGSLSYDSLLKEIADSGLIEYDGETFKFQYRYVYYYSVAHAIRTNVANEHTRNGARQHLTRLASEAHFDDNANILIFYIYLSKDRALMEEVLDNARRIFLDVPPIDLESDLAFANNLLESPISISEPSQNISENLASHRSAKDEAGAQLSRTPADPNDLREAFQIDFAMRSLEIMGQVLKNFPSDLRRDLKLALTKESYSLGLRTMGRFMATLRTAAKRFATS